MASLSIHQATMAKSFTDIASSLETTAKKTGGANTS
jgi:hypothetical protein